MYLKRRMIAGFALLLALPVAVIVFQIFVIHRMKIGVDGANQSGLHSTLAALQLISDQARIDESTRRFFAARLPGAGNDISSLQEDLESDLRTLAAADLSDRERIEVDRLTKFWSAFKVNLASQQQELQSEPGDDRVPSELQDDLDRLRAQTQSVFQANLNFMTSARAELQARGRRAELVSWCVLAIGLLLGILTALMLLRSVVAPLNRLSEGAQALSDGKDFVRLDTSRNDELARIAKAFNSLAERLSEVDSLKKGFISRVSHDLKAPLASLSETLQLLLEQIPGPLTEKQRRLLDLSLQSTGKLGWMIGNLLDLSSIEAGAMEYDYKSQDIASLARSAIGACTTRAQEKKQSIVSTLPDHPLWGECDGVRIKQVLVNIIQNAINFSPPGAAIHVGCRLSDRAPEMPDFLSHVKLQFSDHTRFALVAVSDSGPGVPAGQEESIFHMLHQARSGKKLSGQGIGLGLAISRAIVEAHGGAIWVENRQAGGSEFCVLLPLTGGPKNNPKDANEA